jgi:GTPase SAR1 family protein
MAAKLCVFGGEDSGKSELVIEIIHGKHTACIPLNTLSITRVIDGVKVCYHLWDGLLEHSSSERDQSRFSQADLFILCFSLHNRKSFTDIRKLWLPIIKEYPTIPVVLLGINSLHPQQENLPRKKVSVREIEALRKEVEAEQYLECQLQAAGAINKLFKEITLLSSPAQKKELVRDNSLVSISSCHSYSRNPLEVEKDKKKKISSWRKFFSCFGKLLFW